MIETIPKVLTIAGSDCSGGAGIQADLRTMTLLNVYGASVVTSVTAQSSHGVTAVEPMSPSIVSAQLEALLPKIDFQAVKIGMLLSADNVSLVSDALSDFTRPIIIDPVILSTSGKRLLEANAIESLKQRLIPIASLITPNLQEAALLLEIKESVLASKPVKYLEMLYQRFQVPFLLKGGHILQDGQCTNYLFDGTTFKKFTAPRLNTQNTHGTGCTLASAIASQLALGNDLVSACDTATKLVNRALAHSDSLSLYSSGYGPVNQFGFLNV